MFKRISTAALATCVAALLVTGAAAQAATYTKTVKLNKSGASKTYKVNLPDTDYKSPKITVIPSKYKGSVDVSGKKFQLGGSQFVFKATHVQGITVKLKLVFKM